MFLFFKKYFGLVIQVCEHFLVKFRQSKWSKTGFQLQLRASKSKKVFTANKKKYLSISSNSLCRQIQKEHSFKILIIISFQNKSEQRSEQLEACSALVPLHDQIMLLWFLSRICGIWIYLRYVQLDNAFGIESHSKIKARSNNISVVL